jgi:hypothetical protein
MMQFFRATRTDWLFLTALVWTLFLSGAMVYILLAK